ncbi:MAG: HIT family protein, partial [Thermomicrobiales bacterium]
STVIWFRWGSSFMKDCPFCMENAKIEALIKNEFGYIASTDDPILVNSLMILPFRHVADPFDLSPEEWVATHELLLKGKQLLDLDHPDGYSVGWNVGVVGGQSIPHAHLHVIGRYADEPLAGKGIRHALKQASNQRPTTKSLASIPEI